MIFFIIGAIIGIVMGLTGSGGALVAIPLFISLNNAGLKEASLLSLLAVVFASIINLIPQYKASDYKTSAIMFLTSLVGSYFSIPLKKMMPDTIVAILLSLIALYSLYTIWKSGPKNSQLPSQSNIIITGIAGLILGGLTTLTGLGGGVLLMPLYVGVFKFQTQKAIATSLLTIALASSASLIMQSKDGISFISFIEIIYLLLGMLISAYSLKLITKRFDPTILAMVRKIVFTLVVMTAIAKIF